MALHLITGHKGSAHITSADQGAYNMATFGDGNIVFDRGQKFKATTKSNNAINIADGEAMIQGRFIKMPIGTTEDVTISNGTQGRNRNDLICIRYESESGIESAKLVVIKGAETTGTATDPSYNNGSITDGTATITDFPLYRVSLNGISINAVTPLFSLVVSMAKYMKDYQMPTASKTVKGAVQVGDGINVNGGEISVTPYSLPVAGADTLGGVKVGNNLEMKGDAITVPESIVFRRTKSKNWGGTIGSKTAKTQTFEIPYDADDHVILGASLKSWSVSGVTTNVVAFVSSAYKAKNTGLNKDYIYVHLVIINNGDTSFTVGTVYFDIVCFNA